LLSSVRSLRESRALNASSSGAPSPRLTASSASGTPELRTSHSRVSAAPRRQPRRAGRRNAGCRNGTGLPRPHIAVRISPTHAPRSALALTGGALPAGVCWGAVARGGSAGAVTTWIQIAPLQHLVQTIPVLRRARPFAAVHDHVSHPCRPGPSELPLPAEFCYEASCIDHLCTVGGPERILVSLAAGTARPRDSAAGWRWRRRGCRGGRGGRNRRFRYA